MRERDRERKNDRKEGETNQFITDQHHDDRLGRNPLDGIQVADGIHARHPAIAAFTRALPPRPVVVANALHFAEAIRSPLADEGVFVVGNGRSAFGTGALFARGDDGSSSRGRRRWFLPVGEDGTRQAVGEGVEGLAEGAFARAVVGFGVGDDAFGAGVGVEVRAGGDVVDGCRHGGRCRVFGGGAGVGGGVGGGGRAVAAGWVGRGGGGAVAVVADVFGVRGGFALVGGDEGV